MKLIRLLKRELAREASDWVDDGLITAQQADKILSRYGTRLGGHRADGLGYYLLLSLGVFFAGIAVILLLSANWDDIPRLFRATGLIALMLLLHLAGFLSWRRQALRLAPVWFFAGCLAYGVTIMLIAQMYHLGEHYPEGIYWWTLGVLPFVLFTRSQLLTLLVTGLAGTWAVVEMIEGFMPWAFGPIMLVPLLILLAESFSPFLFVMIIAGLAYWLNLCLSWMAGEYSNFSEYPFMLAVNISIGLLLNALSWRLMLSNRLAWQQYGMVLQLWLLRGLIILLLIFSFEDSWREVYYLRFNGSAPGLGILAGSLALSFWLVKAAGKQAMLSVAVGIYFFVCLLLAEYWRTADVWFALATNILLVLIGIVLIRRGVDQAESHYFYSGVGVLLLLALVRYVDLIGDYVGGAMLFLLASVIMIAAARYWRRQLGAANE